MTNNNFDPHNFFGEFPDFVESSETGHWTQRLNARYQALIHANRELLAGARVLDIASHDGRFGFAALKNGASHAVGIDIKSHLAQTGRRHMATYGVPADRYTFLTGDIFDCLEGEAANGPFDVVFCFGIFYHINHHIRLLEDIFNLGPRAVILDTRVSKLDGAVIELCSPLRGSPPPPGSNLEGVPTRAALEAMLSSFGWTYHYFNWEASGLLDRPQMDDYRVGDRVSLLVSCPEHEISPPVRRKAIAEVLAGNHKRETLYIAVTMVAEKYGIAPQALRSWVQQAERERHQQFDHTV